MDTVMTSYRPPANHSDGSNGAGGRGKRSSNSSELVTHLVLGIVEIATYTVAISLAVMAGNGIHKWLNSKRSSQVKDIVQKMIDNGRKPFKMDQHEEQIATDMVFPSDIDVEFSMIGGLDSIKQQIYDLVALPVQRPDLFIGKSKLIQPPKGILLFGPPGTGKTMMAKAIAKESGAAFIDLKLSTTMNMWFGESQKLVKATFSLASKLSPCIIFIDEIDALFRTRSSGYTGALQSMQAEFMALWDGVSNHNLKASCAYGIIIIGATNRPYDIDRAILRRLPRQFKLDLPNAAQRKEILEIILRDEDVDRTVLDGVRDLAGKLHNYSGSDIKELCRRAASYPVEELSRKIKRMQKFPNEEQDLKLRKITIADLINAKHVVKPTGAVADEYYREEQAQTAGQNVNSELLSAIIQHLQQSGAFDSYVSGDKQVNYSSI